MQIVQTTQTTATQIAATQRVQLLADEFNPSEANNVLTKMLNERINQLKLNYLSQSDRDHSTQAAPYQEKIQQLDQTKNTLADMINEAKANGYKINLVGNIELTLTK